jgi:uncharacterized cupin superfamily protein
MEASVMKIIKVEEFRKMENPNPGTRFRTEYLTGEYKAKELGGLFGMLPPGGRTPYHFHTKRESIIIPIYGEAVEFVDGKESPVGTSDIIYIPTGEKHMLINKSDKDFRYIEFFTWPPASADYNEVK